MNWVRLNTILLILFIGLIQGQDFLRERSADKFAAQGKFKEAIELYQKLLKENPGESRYHYDLGTVFLKNKEYEKAQEQLSKAAASDDMKIRENALYNLGNAFYIENKFGDAFNAYKNVLKINYENQLARENLELSLQKKEEQEQQQDQQKNENKQQQPSDFAKKLKEKADQMVAVRQYIAALQLMKSGLQKDNTVQYYNGYINHLNDVVEIDGGQR